MKAKAKVGDNLLDVIIDNDLDIDGFGEHDVSVCLVHFSDTK